MFAPRFLVDDGRPAGRLRRLLDGGFPHEALVQLLFLQTARAQQVLRDFVVHVYWPKYSSGAPCIIRQDAESLVLRGLDAGKTVKRWSEETIERMAQNVVGCCVDFGLLGIGNRVRRPIRHFTIRPEAALYLVHDLHFSGVGPGGILRHRDWRLFGFNPEQVLKLLKTLANDGHFLVQASGELVQISWKYQSMNDCLHALTER